MKTRIFLLILLYLATSFNIYADEGMWLFSSLTKQYNKMKEMGLRLSEEDIYNESKHSLTNAVVKFGDNGTAVFISENGLLLTSYYNSYAYIQRLGTLTNNYVSDGFWAENNQTELRVNGLSVKVLIKTVNVTNAFIPVLNDEMTEGERQEKISRITAELVKKEKTKPFYDAEVKSFYNENMFCLFVYEVYEDVRLVGVPPVFIGNFGGDSDNWTWPRHSGNFALFRVYGKPNGEPSVFSLSNIPVKPHKSVPVSGKEVKENEFCFTAGFPASSKRNISRHGLRPQIQGTFAAIVKLKSGIHNILSEKINNDRNIYFKYEPKFTSNNNLLKYYRILAEKLGKSKILESKQDEEDKFRVWAARDDQNTRKYEQSLSKIMQFNKDLEEYHLFKVYSGEFLKSGPAAVALAYEFIPLYKELGNTTGTFKKDSVINSLKEKTTGYATIFDESTDKALFIFLIKNFYEDIKPLNHPAAFNEISKKFKNDYTKYTNQVYLKSIFSDLAALDKFLAAPSAEVLDNDPIFKLVFSIYGSLNKLELSKHDALINLGRENRIYQKGILEMKNKDDQYPEANSSLRFSYGKVKGYSPGNAVKLGYVARLSGMLQKYDDSVLDYFLPEKYVETYKKGLFSDKTFNQENIPVCFITDNDVLTGNSGSPVINGHGELTGIIFDTNEDGILGEYIYLPEKQRAIAVSTRFILLIIEKYSNAGYLIKEMNVVK
ncbi:MAG: hypothetical protein A2W91_15310 [Bacteroidetes bacterium GWF2_38_335]|nr:MAG: hypothetical protein A2W91_15310 [Bacteroidetes bacterium GWF2_38_335]